MGAGEISFHGTCINFNSAQISRTDEADNINREFNTQIPSAYFPDRNNDSVVPFSNRNPFLNYRRFKVRCADTKKGFVR